MEREGQLVRRAGVMGLPIGFRFQPTDEELVVHYLRRKAFACPLPADIIPVVDIAKHDPWELPGEGEGEWERYFFYLPEAKYSKGSSRLNRTTSSGFWKATGKEKAVFALRFKRPVGTKRILVFHRGKPPHGSRTDWIMHEYRLAGVEAGAHGPSPRKNAPHSCMARAKDWVVCRIFKKNQARKSDGGQDLSYSRVVFIRGDTAHREGDHEMPSSPSSSCITTELSDNGEESSSSIASSP